jgi:hypothetical protein
MRWTVAIVGCLGAVVAAASPARAQEYCVACAEPNAVYRCVIENAQPGGTIPLQTLCLTAMSKAGGHASCAIKRGTVFDCAGPIKRVPWTSNADDVGPAPPKPEAAKGGDPKEPPSTVQEMADRANKKTADDMKKAGDSVKEGAQNVGEGVSKATKKTWECISSLFAKC